MIMASRFMIGLFRLYFSLLTLKFQIHFIIAFCYETYKCINNLILLNFNS